MRCYKAYFFRTKSPAVLCICLCIRTSLKELQGRFLQVLTLAGNISILLYLWGCYEASFFRSKPPQKYFISRRAPPCPTHFSVMGGRGGEPSHRGGTALPEEEPCARSSDQSVLSADCAPTSVLAEEGVGKTACLRLPNGFKGVPLFEELSPHRRNRSCAIGFYGRGAGNVTP